LTKSSVEIHHVVLVRTSHIQGCEGVPQTQKQQKNMGRMKSMTFAGDCIRFFPQKTEQTKPGYRDSQKTPRDNVRWPSGEKYKVVCERPKCDYGYRQQKDITCMGLIPSFGDPNGFRLGIICNWACPCCAF
jgi:hypothetical protein